MPKLSKSIEENNLSAIRMKKISNSLDEMRKRPEEEESPS